MVIRPHIQRWSNYLSRKEGESWDNTQALIHGRRMAVTRARGEYPVVHTLARLVPTREQVREKYHLTETTDGWLINNLCDPNMPKFEAPTYCFVNGVLLKNGKVIES